MENSLDLVTSQLLEINDISQPTVEDLVNTMMSNKLDHADMFFQDIYSETWILEDGKVRDGSFSIDKGVGVRAVSGDQTGFAFSDDIILPALKEAVNTAKSIAKANQSNLVKVDWKKNSNRQVYNPINPIIQMDSSKKIQLLYKVYELAKKNSKITRVDASLHGCYEMVLIANLDGGWSADIRPLVRLNISVIAEHNGRKEKANTGFGGRYSYEYLLEGNIIEDIVADVVNQAVTNLDSVPTPAGKMVVVLGPGWPGILLHEAIGHGLEGDFIRKKTSVFSNSLGKIIAAPGVTIVDNGTLENRRGSLNIDDEGTESQETILVEDGYLKNFMFDKLNAKLMGLSSTGNGRRENYSCLPMPRMTNTYMAAGQHDPDEIISSVQKGIYATNFGGGQVDITSGKFVFSLCEAYLIENGKVTVPIKGATLIGNGAEVLRNIEMIGNNLQLDNGIGVCDKDGQSVPVGVGQPTLKLSEIVVGGTE